MRRAIVAVAALVALSACSTPFASGRNGSDGVAAMSETQVHQLLHDQGYSNLSGLRFDGKDWTASAMRDGKPVKVDVDQFGIIHIF